MARDIDKCRPVGSDPTDLSVGILNCIIASDRKFHDSPTSLEKYIA